MSFGRLPGERQLRAALAEQDRERRKLATEDVMLGETRRLILRSPNGHFWSLGVNDSGELTATDIGTSL